MRAAGVELPLQVQVTMETTGRMLPGTEIGAALTTLDALHPDVVGLNCATGPEEMYGPIRYLSERSRMPISVIPNAGLPTSSMAKCPTTSRPGRSQTTSLGSSSNTASGSSEAAAGQRRSTSPP